LFCVTCRYQSSVISFQFPALGIDGHLGLVEQPAAAGLLTTDD
jgi:hypothetical protein